MSLETIWLKSAHNLLTVLSSQRFFIFRHCDLYSDTAFFYFIFTEWKCLSNSSKRTKRV